MKGDLVVCCALVNSMKTDMDADEFFKVVLALADYRRKGKALDREGLAPKGWARALRPAKRT